MVGHYVIIGIVSKHLYFTARPVSSHNSRACFTSIKKNSLEIDNSLICRYKMSSERPDAEMISPEDRHLKSPTNDAVQSEAVTYSQISADNLDSDKTVFGNGGVVQTVQSATPSLLYPNLTENYQPEKYEEGRPLNTEEDVKPSLGLFGNLSPFILKPTSRFFCKSNSRTLSSCAS